jgi:hypothetical protein
MPGRVVKRINSRIALDGILVAAVVTLASYIWEIPQSLSQDAMLFTYIFSTVLILSGAYMVFRRVVRYAYEHNQQLSSWPFFFQILIWGLFFAFPCIYNPHNWAWSQSQLSAATPIFGILGWVFVGLGLIFLMIAFSWLGVHRFCGQNINKLEVESLYRVSRNPQLTAGALLLLDKFSYGHHGMHWDGLCFLC